MHGGAEIGKHIPQGTPKGQVAPFYDTPEIENLQRQLKLLEDLEKMGMADPADVAQFAGIIERKAHNAGYLADPGEMVARGEQAIHARKLPFTLENVDIYDMSDFAGPEWANPGLRPFSHK